MCQATLKMPARRNLVDKRNLNNIPILGVVN